MVHYYWMNIQSSAFFAMAVPSLVIFSEYRSSSMCRKSISSVGHMIKKQHFTNLVTATVEDTLFIRTITMTKDGTSHGKKSGRLDVHPVIVNHLMLHSGLKLV